MKFKFAKEKILKVATIALTLTIAVGSLAGCSGVSKSDLKALEKRVTALEKQIDETDSSSSETRETSSPRESSKTTTEPKSSPGANNNNFDAESDFITVTQHDFMELDGDKYTFFIFENDSDFDVTATISIVTKDEDGKVLDEAKKTVAGIGKKKTSFASFAVPDDTDTITRTVSYEEYTSKENALSSLSTKVSVAQGGANITINNNGSSEAKKVKYLTLFFKDGDLVGFDSDSIPSIASSSVETISSVCYEDYDSPKVYLALDNAKNN